MGATHLAFALSERHQPDIKNILVALAFLQVNILA